jgi:nitroreductase
MTENDNEQESMWQNFLRPQWYEAIGERRSRRRFLHVSPLVNLNTWLHHVCRYFRPFPDVEAVLVNRPAETILKGAIGSYGKIRGAQAFVAILGRKAASHAAEQAGYTGEGIVLEATACGLDTCWVGGTFRREAVGEMANARTGEHVFGVIPLGYGAKGWSFTERLMTGFGRTHIRKVLPELMIGTHSGKFPAWIGPALEAARLAPSAFNRQPWRFSTSPDSITVSVENTGRDFGMSKRLDCGIVMLHIELGAMSQGITGKWEFLTDPQVARFTETGEGNGKAGGRPPAYTTGTSANFVG